MARKMVETINAGSTGLVFKNSVFLPFHFELISVWVGKEMSFLASPEHYVDFCGCDGDVGIRTGETYTNLIFREYKDLVHEFSKNRGHVVLYCTEKGADLFQKDARHYVKIGFEENSRQTSLELIDDPFDL